MVEHKSNKKTNKKHTKDAVNPNGRPPIFKTPEEYAEKISEYFNNCPDKRTIFFKLKDRVERVVVPHVTICKLCYYLGFESRQSFYDYEKKGGVFSYITKRARLFVEGEYEKMMLDNPAGAIFALKNMGWRDTQHLDQTINEYLHEDLKDETVDTLQARLDALREQNK